MSAIVSHVLHSVPLASSNSEPGDGELLTRFIDQQDDRAFAQLMNRHGRTVYGMARRLLKNPADADDVCQAAFLILARKAPRLERQRSVAGWLVGVVRRLAADVRKMQQRRTRHEQQSASPSSTRHDASLLTASREIGEQIDDALARLPRKYREPLLLCYWEGLTKHEATVRLGWKPGTLSGRLARGKSLLKIRLERKGIIPTVILAWFSGAGLSQALPTLVTTQAARQALTHLAGLRSMTSTTIFQLVQGALRSMMITQAKWVSACIALAGGILFLGAGTIPWSQAQESSPALPIASRSAVQPANTDQEKIQGKWHCVAVAMGGNTPDEARKSADALRDSTWMEFKGDTVAISGSPAEKSPAKFTLRTDLNPKQIAIEAGPMKLIGLYTLEDGLLVFRYSDNATEAPKSFALGQKSSGILFVMQRERSAHQGAATGKPLGAVARSTAQALTESKMKQIGIAIHNYASAYQSLPGNVYDKNGKAILSWRVKLLPYLEMEQLAGKFKMDEPWDSPHNKELLKLMPDVFRANVSPGAAAPDPYTTPFRSFMGKDTLHQFNKKFNFPDITDGTSNTFLFVEAAKAVPWTSPDDLEYDPAKPFPAVGGRYGNEFLTIFCDGSFRSLPMPTEKTSKNYFKMVTPAGNEVIEPDAGQ